MATQAPLRFCGCYVNDLLAVQSANGLWSAQPIPAWEDWRVGEEKKIAQKQDAIKSSAVCPFIKVKFCLR